jgi:uncharacterized membrane protein YkvA (DUF1232 family)
MAEHDPFPRERAAATVRRMPAYLKLSWRLARDPLLSRARRAAVVGAAGYLASPIDLVPGVIPVAGQLDDIAVALGALKFALAGLDAERRREHLSAVGLEDGDLAEDLRTVAATSAWMVRAGARTTARAAKGSAKAAAAGARVAGQAATRVAPVARGAASKAAPVARTVASTAGTAASKAAPVARTAASTAGAAASKAAGVTRKAAPAAGAAKGAAAKGFSKVKGLAGRKPAPPEVRVSESPPPALGPGTLPAEDQG